jgi:hypothetical protein
MGASGTKATDEFETDAAAANQISWLSANTYPGSRRHPKRLSIKSFLVKSTLVAQNVERSSRQRGQKPLLPMETEAIGHCRQDISKGPQ